MGLKCGTACLAVLLLLCRHWHVRCPLTGGRQAATEDWCKRRGSGCSSHNTLGRGSSKFGGLSIRLVGFALPFPGQASHYCPLSLASDGQWHTSTHGCLVFNGVFKNCHLAVYEARQDFVASTLALLPPRGIFFLTLHLGKWPVEVAWGST